MVKASLAEPARRRAAFLLPETLIAGLDRLAEASGRSRSSVAADLLAGQLGGLPADADPDLLVYESRRHEPDIPLEQCTDLLTRVEKLLAA